MEGERRRRGQVGLGDDDVPGADPSAAGPSGATRSQPESRRTRPVTPAGPMANSANEPGSPSTRPRKKRGRAGGARARASPVSVTTAPGASTSKRSSTSLEVRAVGPRQREPPAAGVPEVPQRVAVHGDGEAAAGRRRSPAPARRRNSSAARAVTGPPPTSRARMANASAAGRLMVPGFLGSGLPARGTEALGTSSLASRAARVQRPRGARRADRRSGAGRVDDPFVSRARVPVTPPGPCRPRSVSGGNSSRARGRAA